jgi:hypothetical protein
VIILGAGIIFISTYDLEQIRLFDLSSFINIDVLMMIDVSILVCAGIYVIIMLMISLIRKNNGRRTSAAELSEKYSLRQKLLMDLPMLILSGISIILASYPILFMIAFSFSDIFAFLSYLDYILITINALLMPLTATIIAVVALLWKKYWVTKFSLFYSVVFLINGLFLVFYFLIPDLEIMIV